jgi:guanylate kinase
LIKSTGASLSVSVTTRAPRPGETDGRDYFFYTRSEFNKLRDGGGLLEHAEYGGNNYGTPRRYVEEQIAAGGTVILEIDVAGALQIKKSFDESVLIFLTPPDKTELKRRLVSRGTQTEASVSERLARADWEIGNVNAYDYFVINDAVEEAVHAIQTIIAAERLKTFRSQAAVAHFINAGEN